jgi:crossover junction endodeoxyribonuclease RuvC
LKTIFDAVAALIAHHAPAAVALEESFVGVDARTALSVGQARGAVLVASARAGVACAEYAPTRVKQVVCGYGRAEKSQVQRMVKTILGLERVPTPNHAADALAVAICHALAPPLLKVSPVSGARLAPPRRGMDHVRAGHYNAVRASAASTASRRQLRQATAEPGWSRTEEGRRDGGAAARPKGASSAKPDAERARREPSPPSDGGAG